MPYRACIICGSPSIKGGSRCPAHARSNWDRWKARNPNAALYATAQWKTLRDQVLAEEPVCTVCQVRPSTEADHIRPVAEGGGFFDRANLRGICKSCHQKKSSSEGGRGAKAKREARDS